jgi:hypothetical protein
MLEILKKIFEANPDKSKIVVNGKCLDCGCDVIIEITPTSGGYGLQGGALFKRSNDEYCTKCPDCYKINPKINVKKVI